MKKKILVSFALLTVLSTVVFAVQTATRIRFARGTTSATMKGNVPKNGKRDYIVGAKKGQELYSLVESDCEDITLDVIDKGTGQSLTDATKEYRDELPGTGDYVIRVQSGEVQPCPFTLTVSIE